MVGRKGAQEGGHNASASRRSCAVSAGTDNDPSRFQLLGATAAAKQQTISVLPAGLLSRLPLSAFSRLDPILSERPKIFHYMHSSIRKEDGHA